jgi:hypothetical protein
VEDREVDMRRVISLFRQLEDDFAAPRLSDDAEPAPSGPELPEGEQGEPAYFVELLEYLRRENHRSGEGRAELRSGRN